MIVLSVLNYLVKIPCQGKFILANEVTEFFNQQYLTKEWSDCFNICYVHRHLRKVETELMCFGSHAKSCTR